MNMFYHAPMPSTAASDSPMFLNRASNTSCPPTSPKSVHQNRTKPASSILVSSSMGGITGPPFPRHEFTDETLIYVVVRIRQDPQSQAEAIAKPHTLVTKLSNIKKYLLGNKKGFLKYGNIRIVRMPREYYLRYFARDKNDAYVGTEPEREWDERELEEVFGRYRECEMPKWVMVRKGDGDVYLAEDRGVGRDGKGWDGNESESESESESEVEWKEEL